MKKPLKMKKIKRSQRKKSEERQSLAPAGALCRGLAVSYALTCAVFIVFALILTYTGVSEKAIPLVSMACTIVAALLCGIVTAKGTSEKGLVWGLAAGALYGIILFALGGFLGKGFSLDMSHMTTLIIAVCGGGAGGILGVNL